MTAAADERRRAAYAAYMESLNRLSGLKNNAEQDYSTGVNTVEQSKPGAFRNLLNQYAGRGMANSSGYGFAQQETENAFAKTLADMLTSKTRTITDLTGQEGAAGTQYQGDLGEISAEEAAQIAADQQSAAMLAAQQAPQPNATGQLGYSEPGAAAAPNLASGGGQAMTRAQFLRTHPELEQRIQSGDRNAINTFLKNHPDIARAWARY